MFCPKCGNKLNDNAMFCPKCGYRVAADDRTKEINIGVLKDLTGNLDLNNQPVPQPAPVQVPKKSNNNKLIISCALIVIVALVLVILIITSSKKSYVNSDDIDIYCSQNSDSDICKSDDPKEKGEFDPLYFGDYDLTSSSSLDGFTTQVENVLKQKETDGNKFCNDKKYEDLNSKLDKDLNLKYSYTCGVDVTFMNNLNNRLQQFYKLNNIKENLVDSYLVGNREANVYADFSTRVVGQVDDYYAYIRRIYLNVNIFNDYDRVSKTYNMDLKANFHPKNSIPEDVIVHETAHAFNYLIVLRQLNGDVLAGDNIKDYTNVHSDFFSYTYAKKLVEEGTKIINDRLVSQGLSPKTEEELRIEISGYANQKDDYGNVIYAETFAEAMVDYLANGDNASPLSIEIYKLVQEDLKELEG